jgi:hypothetical protein
MFLELLLMFLLAIILVRVLASIKMATEHAVAHWNQAQIINELTAKGNIVSLEANPTLRRSARIQKSIENKEKA